jgi:hypothetical protein
MSKKKDEIIEKQKHIIERIMLNIGCFKEVLEDEDIDSEIIEDAMKYIDRDIPKLKELGYKAEFKSWNENTPEGWDYITNTLNEVLK